jgi:hypothetical protein
MAWTQSDIDTLKGAIATGALSVMYSDNSSVQYRSLADMKATLPMMEAEVNAATTTYRAFRGAPRSGY